MNLFESNFLTVISKPYNLYLETKQDKLISKSKYIKNKQLLLFDTKSTLTHLLCLKMIIINK